MTEFVVEGNKRSRIFVGDTLQQLQSFLPAGRIIAITDTNVYQHYAHLLKDFLPIVIEPGEDNKNLNTVESVYRQLMDRGADRSTYILGFGGGIVCDVAGFVASTFMRGLSFGFVSTSLLSQVDASVGGKNGVNFLGIKNMVGTFNQPDFVLCDPIFLKTLPQKEILSGFGEIIKHALIADEIMVTLLEENYSQALVLNEEIIEKLVLKSIEIKSRIVNKDERENGERRKLNFGHTFGHAIESMVGLSHGESVAIGMVLAARFSLQHNLLERDDVERIEKLISAYSLPTKIDTEFNILLDIPKKDKKRDSGSIHFVMLDSIGKAVVKKINPKELEQVVDKRK